MGDKKSTTKRIRIARLVQAVEDLLSAPSSEMHDRLEDVQITFDGLTETDLKNLFKPEHTWELR
jgi:hypothetical protein